MRVWNTMVLGLFVFGCSAKQAKPAVAAASSAKSTVVEKNWIENPPADACAVGSAPLSPGMTSLARTASSSAARVEIARQIKTKVEGMVKTYQSQQMSDGKMAAEQDLTNINRDIVNMEIHGSKVRATKERDGELFSLVCIDPEAMQEAIDKMNSMSETMRTAIKTRMNDEFKDLDTQIERLTQ
jgi:hypothetical protein